MCGLPMWLATGFLLAGWPVGGSASLVGQEVDEPLLGATRLLSGQIARTELVVPVYDPAETPMLSLDVEFSDLLDRERSVLTVRVNDRPVRSARLDDVNGSVAVPLAAEAGFQRVVVESRLFVEGDPCLVDYRDSAWLALLPTSRIRYRSTAADPQEEPAVPVAQVAERWLASGATEVFLDVPRASDPGLLQALLDVDHLVRGWGLEPTYDLPVDDASPGLRVTVGMVTTDSAWQSVANESDVAAVARSQGRRLGLHATDAEGIRRMVALLSDPEALRLCAGATCMVGPEFRRLGASAADPTSSGATFDLVDAGYPEGWVAEGVGRHQLQLVWQRPPWWQLRRWPELRLRARIATPLEGPGASSRLTVHLNGQPLGSFALSDRVDDLVSLSLRVPPRFWTADEWLFRITARLDDDSVACTASDPEEYWLVLEPESGLYVPRTEELFDGISELYENGPLPTLTGDATLAARHLPALAAVLYPYRERLARAPFRWAADCTDGCMRLTSVEGFAPAGSTTLTGTSWVVDRGGDLRIPLLPEPGHYQLARAGSDLILAVPTAPEPAAVPDYMALRGGWALFVNGSWVVRDADEPTGRIEVGPEGRETMLLSREQQWARLINFLWLCAAILIVAVGGFWIWRARRNAARDAAYGIEVSSER